MAKIGFEAKVEELKRYRKRLRNTDIANTFKSIVKKGIFELQGRVIKETPVDRGGLRSSWNVEIQGLEATLANNKEYGIYVHEGTRPHWTSVDNLRGWAKRKGINPYAVQKSIARKGTKGNPFMDRAYEEGGEQAVEGIATREIDKLLNTLSK